MGNSPALGTPNLNLDQPLPTGGQPADKMKITTQDLHRAGWASSLGSALEYYDFALYSLASALIFGPLFFPAQDPAVGLLASFGTYFIGFAIRPVGGIVFGILSRVAQPAPRMLPALHRQRRGARATPSVGL